jgi:hypothetical protein
MLVKSRLQPQVTTLIKVGCIFLNREKAKNRFAVSYRSRSLLQVSWPVWEKIFFDVGSSDEKTKPFIDE